MQPDEPDGPPERIGPAPLSDDSWDTAPTRTHDVVRRHRTVGRLPWMALILAIMAVPVVVVSLLLSAEWPSGSPAAAPVATMTSATPKRTTPAPTPSAVPVVTTTEDIPAGPPPFTGLVYEAEAGRPAVSLRRAEVVQLDGAWGGAGVQFTSRSGSIEFESIDVSSRDSYRVTIIYASRGDWSGVVYGSRDSERVRFDEASRCCDSTSVVVRLSPGGDLTIELSRGNGPLPTIDRITIEAA